MAGFDNDVVYGTNVDFTGTSPVSGQINLNGELLVGASVAPFLRAYVPTGSSNVHVTTGAGTLDFSLSGPPSATSLTSHGVVVGQGTSALTTTAVGSTGQVLQGVSGSDPTYSTATYPSTSNQGDILYSTSSNIIGGLAKDTNATRYLSNTGASNNPAWAQVALATGVSGTLPVANGGTSLTTLTAHALYVGNGTSAPTALSVGATGTLLVGATTADPAFGTSATGDFTFTSATAGATRTLTVSNTDNTNAASKALVQVTTGGTSSGDALTTYTISGTTNWSVGTDNSVTGDPFVIAASTALGTTNIMSATTAGEINYPLQPAFLAKESSSPTNVTGDGTAYTMIFDAEIFDQNADFDGTSTFTAPANGKYWLSSCVRMNGLLSTHTLGRGGLETSNRDYSMDTAPSKIFDTANACMFQLTLLADMETGDTAVVKVTISNGTKVVDVVGNTDSTYFCGALTV